MMEITNTEPLLLCIQCIVVLIVVLIICFQSDRFACAFLSPNLLRRRRRQTQNYNLNQAIATSISTIRQYTNQGGVYQADVEKDITECLVKEEEIQVIVEDIVNGVRTVPLIVGISLDLSPKVPQDYYIFLAFPVQDTNGNEMSGSRIVYGKRVQIPLLKFCTIFTTALKQQSSKDMKLCFVADASSGLGSHIMSNICQVHPDLSIVQEPAWMTTIAYLTQMKLIDVSNLKNTMQDVLYSLCQLEVLSTQRQKSNNEVSTESIQTAVVTLPGQSSTSILIPMLQSKFPPEQYPYIWLYDELSDSVERAVSKKWQNAVFSTNSTLLSKIPPTSLPKDCTCQNPIMPIKINGFPQKLQSVSYDQAGTIESWMTSVNKLLNMLEQESPVHVCRLISLVGKKVNKLELERLVSFIMTGSCTTNQAHIVDDPTVDAIQSVLTDISDQLINASTMICKLTEMEREAIQKCASCHEGIAFIDKTLDAL